MAERNGAGMDSVERLRNDVAALQEQLSDLLKTAAKTGTDGASAARDQASRVAETVKDATALYGRQSYDAINECVQRHPLACLAGAAVFGAILARIIQRPHH